MSQDSGGNKYSKSIRMIMCIIKTNTLLNLINNQPDIDKIYLYAKDTYEDKYQFLINKRESIGLNILMIPKLLLSIRMICMIFIKILMIIILIKKIKN